MDRGIDKFQEENIVRENENGTIDVVVEDKVYKEIPV